MCKTFKTQVTKTDGMKVDEQGRFITRHNVDVFFMQSIRPKNNILTSTMSKHSDTLHHQATYVEHSHPEKFHVKSLLVQLVLDSHSNKKEHIRNKVECVHGNFFRNMISQDYMCSLMNCGMQNLKWADCASSLTAMTQTNCRSEHTKESKLCDIRISLTHGPLKQGCSDTRWLILTIIDQKHMSRKALLISKNHVEHVVIEIGC